MTRKISISSHHIQTLPANTIKKLKSLTFGVGGMMEDELINRLNSLDDNEISEAIIVRKNKNIIGWALFMEREHMYIYVDPKFRRQGIGRKIFNLALTMTEDNIIYVHRHDDCSAAFFDSLPGAVSYSSKIKAQAAR